MTDFAPSTQNRPGGITIRVSDRLRCACGHAIKAYDVQLDMVEPGGPITGIDDDDAEGVVGIRRAWNTCPNCHHVLWSVDVGGAP